MTRYYDFARKNTVEAAFHESIKEKDINLTPNDTRLIVWGMSHQVHGGVIPLCCIPQRLHVNGGPALLPLHQIVLDLYGVTQSQATFWSSKWLVCAVFLQNWGFIVRWSPYQSLREFFTAATNMDVAFSLCFKFRCIEMSMPQCTTIRHMPTKLHIDNIVVCCPPRHSPPRLLVLQDETYHLSGAAFIIIHNSKLHSFLVFSWDWLNIPKTILK